jgi:hypothetical protein
MKLTFRGIIAIVLAIIMSYFAVYLIGVYRGRKQTAAVLDPGGWLATQESLKTVKAELKSSEDMLATLLTGNQALHKKVKVNAATIADLTARLGKVSGGGPAKPGDDDWSVFQDQYLTAFFRQAPDSLQYTLFERPIKVSIIEDLNNQWSAYAWDALADAPIPIDKLDVQRSKDFSPAKPWFKRLATVAKYVGVGAVAGSLGYVAGRIF